MKTINFFVIMAILLSCATAHANEPAQKIDFTAIANDAVEIREATNNNMKLKGYKFQYTIFILKDNTVRIVFSENNKREVFDLMPTNGEVVNFYRFYYDDKYRVTATTLDPTEKKYISNAHIQYVRTLLGLE